MKTTTIEKIVRAWFLSLKPSWTWHFMLGFGIYLYLYMTGPLVDKLLLYAGIDFTALHLPWVYCAYLELCVLAFLKEEVDRRRAGSKFVVYWRWSGTGIRDWAFYCLPGVGLMLMGAIK